MYTVQAGDSASAIAARYGLTFDQFMQFNPNGPQSGDWNLIQPGEVFNTGAPASYAPPPAVDWQALGIAPPATVSGYADHLNSGNVGADPRWTSVGTMVPISQTSTPLPNITPPSFTGSAGLADPNYVQSQGINPNTNPYTGPTNMPQPVGGITGNTPDDILNAQRAVIAAQRAALEAKMAGTAPSSQLREADRELLKTREEALSANKAYLNEQQRANEARLQEEGNIQAAQKNTGDILAVARAQRTRDSLNYRYSIAGLPTPIEVKLPPTYQGPMPPGIVARLQTLAEILQDKSQDAEKMRQFRIEAARIHAANTGQKVEAAQIARGRVALTLEEVEEAARIAGFLVDEAQLNLAAAQLPPQGGLVYDEITGTWVTPNQASINQGLNRQQLMNQMLGPLGSVPIDTLMSMATQKSPVISDAELRQALIVQGIDPSVADRYVQLAQQRRTTSESTGFDLSALADLVNQAIGGQTTAPPTGNGYAHLFPSIPYNSAINLGPQMGLPPL